MDRRYPAIAATALSMTSPGPVLSLQQAKKALRKHEDKAVRQGYIDTYRIVRSKRTAPRRIRFYVKERLGPKDGSHLNFDGPVGVWLRDGKTIIRYPGNRRG